MNLSAEKRQIKGKKVKTLRREGYVPAVISVAGKDSVLIKIDVKDAQKIKDLDHIEKITIEVDGKKYDVLVSEIVVDPLNNKILHISFSEVTPKSHVIVNVPIRIKGISPAVKNNIGVMLRNLTFVRLVFNSENIIPYLEVDVSGMENVGDRILFTPELLPENVKPASFKDFGQTIVTIRPPQKARVTTTVEEVAEGEETTAAESSEATE